MILGIFIALETAFLAILVPLSLSFSKDLIVALCSNESGKVDNPEGEKAKIISYWYFSDFMMSATAYFSGYSLIVGFIILLNFEKESIILVFKIISIIYLLGLLYSLWKVLVNRVFTEDKNEKWNLGGIITIIYIVIWDMFFIIVSYYMVSAEYKNAIFWLSIKSIMLFLTWYVGGIIYLPLTNLYRLKKN